MKILKYLGITCVGGNSTLENTKINALKSLYFNWQNKYKLFILELIDLLNLNLITASHVHGKSGLDIEGSPYRNCQQL